MENDDKKDLQYLDLTSSDNTNIIKQELLKHFEEYKNSSDVTINIIKNKFPEYAEWNIISNAISKILDEYLEKIQRDDFTNLNSIFYNIKVSIKSLLDILDYKLKNYKTNYPDIHKYFYSQSSRGMYSFSDIMGFEQTFFTNVTKDDDWMSHAAEMIHKKFRGRCVEIVKIHCFVITDTPYLLRKRF